MKDIKNLLKGAVDKIKSTVEKEEIPLEEAFSQMNDELEEAEKAYGKPLFPDESESVSLNEYYLKILGFKEEPENFELIETHYQKLMQKCNPENFADDANKKSAAEKQIVLIQNAYEYFKQAFDNETDNDNDIDNNEEE